MGMRWLAGVAVLFLVATPFAACVQVIGADGYLGAASSLCELLAQCYTESRFPDCEARAGDALSNADPGVRAQFLAAFGAEGCLENCSNAEDCLDLPPICEDIGAACEQLENCCGFTGNAGDCIDGRCCLPDAQRCNGAGQCCTSCDLHTATCGGKPPCLNQDEVCEIDDDCCSNNCDKGICSFVCRAIGEDCGGPNDCCSDHCENLKCACKPGGESCSFHDQCCNGFCDPQSNVCVDDPGCAVFGSDCDALAMCCEGLSCGPASQCCYPPGNACPADPATCCGGECADGLCCTPQGADCTDPNECCRGGCRDNVCHCGEIGDACNDDTDCCHAVCRPGGCVCNAPGCHSGCMADAKPLSLTNDNCTMLPSNGVSFECLQAICAADPYCCCVKWDDGCVNDVLTFPECAGSCDITTTF